MSTAYQADPQSQVQTDTERLHEHCLFAFLESVRDLSNFGYSTAQLAEMVARELEPRVVRFPAGTVDPFDGEAA